MRRIALFLIAGLALALVANAEEIGAGDALLDGDLLSAEPAPAAGADDDLLGGDLLSPEPADDDDLLGGDLLSPEPATGGDDDLLGGDLLSPDTGGGDDDLLGGDLLDGEIDEPKTASAAEDDSPVKLDEAAAAHLALFSEDRYPSANTCGSCHPKQFDQWSVSQHAYAQMSPVYMAMQNTINAQTSNTNGDFCIRCHTQIGMNKGESTYISNLERHPASREGITCVVCHRLDQEYGKVSGRVALVEGDLTQPVYGPTDGAVVKAAIENSGGTLTMDPEKSGRKIHGDVGHFPFIGTSGFCAVCHDVNLFNGFRLEEAFSDYKRSPASAAGTSCQDCHMGAVQGKVSGYEQGPAATIGSKSTPDRKLTNHFFAGPDYSLLHPGIFPHNIDAVKMATLADWLKFDVEAGWGTDEFEDAVAEDYEFPKRWQAIDDRYDARAIIDHQLERLAWAEEKRFEVLRNGYGLSDIRVTRDDGKSLRFEVDVMNKTDGHSVPTGFDAERVVWVEATVTDAAGKVVYASGDLDPNGDLRDAHSLYVHNGDLPLDRDLLSLQSKFITRNVRGGEREQVLAVNYSVNALPFIRPSTSSTILTGQPAGARKHRYVLPPLASRTGVYNVKGLDPANGPYEITTRLKTGMIPINLIFEIQGVGFDYGMSPRDVADAVVKGHQVLYEHKVKVGGASMTAR